MSTIGRLRKALEMLTEGQRAPIRATLKPEAEQLRAHSVPWTQGAGIQGIGIGSKLVNGRKQKELALKIYVEKKLPIAKVSNPVPTAVRVPGIQQPLMTDVEEIGKVELEPNTMKIRPVVPGFGVSHVDVTVGTLGCLARRNDDENGLYILSNSHVLANDGVAEIGDLILQPGRFDGGRPPEDAVAKLADWVPFEFTRDGFPNLVDAAIAKVVRESDVDPEIRRIGIPAGVSKVVRRGMKVQKTGRTTDYTIGEIMDIDYRLALDYRKSGSTFGRVGLRDQVLCTRFTAAGDSGSAVLNMSGKVVGLHFAGSPSTSIFNRMEHVIDQLDISIVTNET